MIKRKSFKEIVQEFDCISDIKVFKNEVIVIGYNHHGKKEIKNYYYSNNSIAKKVKSKVQNFLHIKG